MLDKAQELVLSFFDPDIPKRGYKAPHAYQGTPPRPHRVRRAWDRLRKTHGPFFKLFKGHRP